jgi:hypothetical protein
MYGVNSQVNGAQSTISPIGTRFTGLSLLYGRVI